jgi:hypothetical protein
MATLDEIRLQQLLRPFENQSGIVGTNTGNKMMNNIPLINTTDILNQYNVPNLQNRNLVNQDLINQIIADNQKNTKIIIENNKARTVPISYPNVSDAPLRFATDDQASFFFPSNNKGITASSAASTFGTPVDIEQGFTRNTPSDQGTNFQFLPSANEADETDEVKETKTGIAKLFDFLTNFIPGVGLLKRLGDVPGGIKSLNQRLRNTDFGRSRTGAEYAMLRRERKQSERAQEAMPDVYRSAREQGFTNQRGGFSTQRADRAGTSVGSGQFSSKRSTGRQGY